MASMSHRYTGLMSGTSLEGIDDLRPRVEDRHIAFLFHTRRVFPDSARGNFSALLIPAGHTIKRLHYDTPALSQR